MLRFRRSTTAVASLFLFPLFLASCQQIENDAQVKEEVVSNGGLSQDAVKLWENYVSETEGLPLQESCKPRRFKLPEGVKYKGVAIFYHGFTACSQQYFEWAEKLNSQGFEVLLPLIPGHGRLTVNGVDDISGLPTLKNIQKYQDLVLKMNSIARVANGEKVTGGLSVGGSLATAAFKLDPALYNRVVIVSPLYTTTNVFARSVLQLTIALRSVPLSDPLMKLKQSWGEGCHDERSLGRAGICDFLVTNVAAAEKFGNEAALTVPFSSAQIQIIGVEDDQVASTWEMKSVAKKLKDAGDNVSICFFAKGANHSLFSRFDNPHEDMFWLDALLDGGTNFVANGKAMPEDKTVISSEWPASRCKI